MSHEILYKQISEARRELDHIRGALQRIEHLCRTTSQSAMDRRLFSEQQTLNGWVVSLLETNISMVEIIAPSHNPLIKAGVILDVQKALQRPKFLGLY